METIDKHLAWPNDFISACSKNKYNLENLEANSILSPNRFEKCSTKENFSKVNHQIDCHQRETPYETLSENNSNTPVKRHSNSYTYKTFIKDESKDNGTHKYNLVNSNIENNKRHSKDTKLRKSVDKKNNNHCSRFDDRKHLRCSLL